MLKQKRKTGASTGAERCRDCFWLCGSEKEHVPGSRPHWDLSGRPNRPPQQVGGINDGITCCVSGRSVVQVGRGFLVARLLSGAASYWRGFVLRTGGTGASRRGATKAAVPLHRGSMAGRDPCTTPPRTDPFFASEDPLCLSPEDDLRPPARERTWFWRLSETPALASLPASKTFSVSLQRMTCGPLQARLSLSLPRGRGPVLGGWQNTGPRVSPLHRGEQEGSCDAGIPRFPHWLTGPWVETEHRSPAGLPPTILGLPLQSFRNARTQESQNRRGPMIRGPAGGGAGAGARAGSQHPPGRSTSSTRLMRSRRMRVDGFSSGACPSAARSGDAISSRANSSSPSV